MSDISENRTLTTTVGAKRTVISVDAMGGDLGPAAVVAGLSKCVAKNPDIGFVIHGDEAQLAPLLKADKALAAVSELRHADDVVTMNDKPSQIMRHGQKTSMWSAIDAVKNGDASTCVSCGNTGALMVLSMLRLRKIPGVNRPAIAVLWPSRNPQGFNILLDAGADIRADEMDLMQYALMGASFARNGLAVDRPRVGLLNVGTEEHKGRAEIKAAHELIEEAATVSDFDYVGFVEGSDMPSDKVDVIVTDGFSGNVALKTAEGTANLVKGFLKDAFKATPASKLAAFIAAPALKRLSKRMDPRRSNGGVFLGLNGTVVKSHGSADATAMAAAVNLAFNLAHAGFQDKLAARVAYTPGDRQDETPSN
ncbi:MAG: phosphate acyltransferase PlsX [Maritimibacter sp.]